MSIELTHITPRFAPQIDGLGDYSRLMAEQLRFARGFQSRFIVGDPQWSALPAVTAPTFPAAAVGRQTADELLEQLGAAPIVVLHYVPYGYHPRGIPWWVNRALQTWKKSAPDRRLIVIFHELWASGPPWKSEFYLSFLQRRLASDLYRLCHGALTSTALMRDMLEKIQPGKTRLMPIPSAFPQMKSLAERTFHRGGPVRVIAFGQEASRHLSIKVHEPLLRALHAEGLLAGFDVVGKGAIGGVAPSPDVRLLRSFLPPETIHVHRDVSSERGAQLLQSADLFLSYYPSILLCKSSALTAALAGGCIPLLQETREANPLVEGTHVLACNGSLAEIEKLVTLIRSGQLGSIGEAGWSWYNLNASWTAAGQEMVDLIKSK